MNQATHTDNGAGTGRAMGGRNRPYASWMVLRWLVAIRRTLE